MATLRNTLALWLAGRLRVAATVLLLVGGCLWASGLSTDAEADSAGSDLPAAQKLYRRACDHLTRGYFEQAFATLRESLGYGHTHPMQVVSDSCFAPLLADPAWRAALRGLLRRHAWEDSTVMVAPGEPGERIRLRAWVTDAHTGAPVARATLELVQADSQGRSLDADGTWNPRLFAYLLTDDSGRVQVETIRPGACVGSGDTVAAHVQLTITGSGYAALEGRILFSDDPRLAGGLRDQATGPAYVAERLEGGPLPPSFRVKVGIVRQK